MTRNLLVLDVHGVVFNSPLANFLADLDARSGPETSIWSRWDKVRTPFWEGRMSEADMWAMLAPGDDIARLRADLESRYSPGPYYDYLFESDHRCWLLTNHRTDWLIPRLERFKLDSRFEKIIVSDRIGAAKPSRTAFKYVIEAARGQRTTFIDDNILNVRAARASGLNAVLADGFLDWGSVAL